MVRFKKVVTLDGADLERDSELLARLVVRDYMPQAVLGIATGGALVARHMSFGPDTQQLECAMRRVGTTAHARWGIGASVLSRTPYCISDTLRRIEDGVLERRGSEPRSPTEELIRGVHAAGAAMLERGLKRLLVVDDAVDSGATLHCVLSVIASLKDLSGVDVQTASIAVTRTLGSALATPDYSVYRDTLCRFPWSADHHGRR